MNSPKVSETPQSSPLAIRERPSFAVLALAPAILALDQITKLLVVDNMQRGQTIPVLGSFFRLTYTHNRGAAFGLDLGSPAIHTLVSLVALGILVWLFWNLPAKATVLRLALILVLGGALGNIVDRIRLLEVIDFFDFGIGEQWRWPIFNIADSFVTIGIVILAIGYSRHKGDLETEGQCAAVTDDVPRDSELRR